MFKVPEINRNLISQRNVLMGSERLAILIRAYFACKKKFYEKDIKFLYFDSSSCIGFSFWNILYMRRLAQNLDRAHAAIQLYVMIRAPWSLEKCGAPRWCNTKGRRRRTLTAAVAVLRVRQIISLPLYGVHRNVYCTNVYRSTLRIALK